MYISILCILAVHICIYYVFVYPVLFFCTYIYILCILVPRFFEQFVPDDQKMGYKNSPRSQIRHFWKPNRRKPPWRLAKWILTINVCVLACLCCSTCTFTSTCICTFICQHKYRYRYEYKDTCKRKYECKCKCKFITHWYMCTCKMHRHIDIHAFVGMYM